jgi:hypothetical protein
MFKFHSDAGHGWLEVPKYLLKDLGVSKKITGYSYQKDGIVYCEEDMDYDTFIRAHREQIGPVEIDELDSVDHSEIRGYQRYRA